MGVNIVQKRTGEKIIDLTDATLSAQDNNKVLIGESAYGRDGNKINGAMPDYTTFPCYFRYVDWKSITPSSSVKSLELPIFNLSGLPIRWLQINSSFNIENSSSSGTNYLLTLTYSYDNLLSATGTSYRHFIMQSLNVRKSSNNAVGSNGLYVSTGEAGTSVIISNREQKENKGCTITLSSPYFKSGVTYLIFAGG